MITNPRVGQRVENRYQSDGVTPAYTLSSGVYWYRCMGVRGVITSILDPTLARAEFSTADHQPTEVTVLFTRLVAVDEVGLCRAAKGL